MLPLVPGMTSQFGFTIGDRVKRLEDAPFGNIKAGMLGNVIGFATSAAAPGGYLVYAKFDEFEEPYGSYFEKIVKVPVVLKDSALVPIEIPGLSASVVAPGGGVTYTLGPMKMKHPPDGDLFIGMDPAYEEDKDRAPDGTCTSCYGYPECAVNCEAAARRKKPGVTMSPF